MQDETPHPTELLANHLAPRFGNLYEYNLAENQLAGYDIQEWTDELQVAVKHFLLHELPDDIFGRLIGLDYDTERSKEAVVDQLIASHQPWALGQAVRGAAVASVLTLGQFIGHLHEWQDAGVQEDAALWLDIHASPEQLAELVQVAISHSRPKPGVPWFPPEPRGWKITWHLTPPVLLAAWRRVSRVSGEDAGDADEQHSGT